MFDAIKPGQAVPLLLTGQLQWQIPWRQLLMSAVPLQGIESKGVLSMMLNMRIRAARLKAGLSQAEMAAALGVGRSAVANWECTSRVAPHSQRLGQIALLTGVSHEWLATGRGSPMLDQDHIPAVDAEMVDDLIERRLLRAYRAAPAAIRQALLQLVETHLPPTARVGHKPA